MPSGGNLPSNRATECKRLRDENASALLELDKPLATLTRPDIAVIAVLVLKFRRLGLGNFDGLEIMDEFNFLVEYLLLGVVPAEELRFCER